MDIQSKFNNEGFVIIRNLIKEKLIKELLESLEKFKSKNIYYYTQSNHTWVKSGNITKEGYLIDSIQSPTKQKNCGQLRLASENIISCPEISNVLKEISGNKKFINWQNMLFDKSTGTIDHADTWYLDTKPRGKMIAAWISLEDINESAGRFFVYPKSHKLNILENINQKFNDNYLYTNFISEYIIENKLKKFIPKMNSGDVLFWHPFTIHGSLTQKDKKYSRKSLTAHYHPVGLKRVDTAENQEDVNRYIRKMRKSKNQSIFFDNADPTDFEFTSISFTKYLLKKILLKNKIPISNFMDREKIEKFKKKKI